MRVAAIRRLESRVFGGVHGADCCGGAGSESPWNRSAALAREQAAGAAGRRANPNCQKPEHGVSSSAIPSCFSLGHHLGGFTGFSAIQNSAVAVGCSSGGFRPVSQVTAIRYHPAGAN